MIYSQYTEFFEGFSSHKIGLLVNGVTGAVDLISGTAYDAWRARLKPELLESGARNRLIERGHFYAGSAEEEHAFFVSASSALHEIATAGATNAFWIIPTYRCNLRCSYCFQEHSLHAGKTPHRDMTPAEATELVDRLDDYGGIGKRSNQPRYITLFGGEPLMLDMAPTVRALVRRAIYKGYKVSAVSNGVDLVHFEDLLGPELIRWIQITLDGIGSSNDKRRQGCGVANFESIAKGIDLALARGVKISLRTNVDRRLLQELDDMNRWVHNRGWTSYKNFGWYTSPVETHTNTSLEKISVTTRDLVEHRVRHPELKARAPYVAKHTATLRKLRQTGIASRIETSACGAHTGMLFFDAQGDIYACAEQAGKVELAVGKWREKEVTQAKLPWQRRHVGASPVCSRCPNAFFCGGGCANAAWRGGEGDFFGPRCNGIKDAIAVASREFASNLLADEGVIDLLDQQMIYSVNEDLVLLPMTTPRQYIENVYPLR